MTSTATPRVTVLMTVLNGMPYLQEAVESILMQTLQDWRFVIVDNGSTDGTTAYLQSLADPRVIILRQEAPLPRTQALNVGFAQITTPYTAILDADDVAEPDRLHTQVAFLDATPSIAAVWGDYSHIAPDGQSLGQYHIPTDHAGLVERMIVQNPCAHSASCYRTDTVKTAGGYPAEYVYAQDAGLWIALLRAGHSFASIPKQLVRIRIHPAQATQDPEKQTLRTEESIRLAQEFMKIPSISARARQTALLRKAFLFFRLRRWGQGLQAVFASIATAPLGFFCNPLFRERLRIEARNRRSA